MSMHYVPDKPAPRQDPVLGILADLPLARSYLEDLIRDTSVCLFLRRELEDIYRFVYEHGYNDGGEII